MLNIKTAISIDAKTLKMVDLLSRKLHISRSRFFTQAAQYMVKKNENLELLQKVNASCKKEDTDDADFLKHAARHCVEKVFEKW